MVTSASLVDDTLLSDTLVDCRIDPARPGQHSDLELVSLLQGQPVQLSQNACDVITAPRISYKSNGGVLDRTRRAAVPAHYSEDPLFGLGLGVRSMG